MTRRVRTVGLRSAGGRAPPAAAGGGVAPTMAAGTVGRGGLSGDMAGRAGWPVRRHGMEAVAEVLQAGPVPVVVCVGGRGGRGGGPGLGGVPDVVAGRGKFVFLADETFANKKKPHSTDETLTANERLPETSQNLSLAITLSLAVAKFVGTFDSPNLHYR